MKLKNDAGLGELGLIIVSVALAIAAVVLLLFLMGDLHH